MSRSILPERACVLDALADAFTAHADDIAIYDGSVSITYREVAARSYQIANYLHTLGVGPETRVGVCIERGLTQIVAMLGVVMAGAAYVPLDPFYPNRRLAYMVAESRLGVLLTDSGHVARFKVTEEEVIALDDPAVTRQLGALPTSRPRVSVIPDNLAYVMFTSGSSGQPKAVANTHRGLMNLVGWLQARFPLGPDDRLLQRSSTSFDASVRELFWPLIAGAAMILTRRRPSASATRW